MIIPEIVHGGLIAWYAGEAGWLGLLITGPSGAGKSDLALRCLGAGFTLVADDRVELWRSGGKLYGRAPDPLAGLIEVRGEGVVTAPFLTFCRIYLVADCVEAAAIERMPDPVPVEHLGAPLPALRIAPLEASAPAKLRRALLGLGTGKQEA
jgi:serine kinase of HPr protein (carbohydrate metabolism regulator)